MRDQAEPAAGGAPGARGELTGKVAIVTGATRGIGRAVAGRFLDEGARVAVNGRDPGGCERAARELGGGAHPLPADVGDSAAVAAAVDAAVERWGRVDVLVNNAGVALDGFLTRVTDDDWNRSLATNLSGAMFATRAVVPHMKARGEGAIVNVVSWAGIRGNVGQASYSASKAGLHGLTLTAAKELAKFGIRVNALAPAAPTGMTEDLPAEQRERVVRRTPLRRSGTPEEAADAALFLASERSSFTTGELLNVDGGIHLT